MSKRRIQVTLALAMGTFAFLAMLALLAGPVTAATHCVQPGPVAIQTAITLAGSGDTIQVGQGTYNEIIVINNKNVVLEGGYDATCTARDSSPYKTIIDGNRAGVVISITNGAAPTIDGFTITNGDASHTGGRGGGIHIREATAIIRNSVISDNIGSQLTTTHGVAGGIYVMSSTTPVRIYENLVQGNVALSVTLPVAPGFLLGVGGGIDVSQGGSAVISGNQILHNIALRTDAPSGILAFGGGMSGSGVHVTIHNNVFRGNWANPVGGWADSGGGAVQLGGASVVTITNNTVVQNTAALSGANVKGGGISVNNVQHALLADNWVMSNTALVMASPAAGIGASADGGGIWLDGGGVANDSYTVESNHIIANVAAQTITVSGAGAVGYAQGGGLCAREISALSVLSTEVRGNVSVHALSVSDNADGGSNGAGIAIMENSVALLRANGISDNTSNLDLGATDDGSGGGVNVSDSTVTMDRNLILRNRMNPSGGGGASGAWAWEADVTSTNDIFAHNFSGIGGGNNSTITLINDTLYDNHGQGAYVQEGSTMLVSNTIVVGHDNGLEIGPQAPASTLIESYNLLSNTTNYNGAVTKGGNTILNQDPLFVDVAADDFHLQVTSPALDSGDDSVAPAVDFEGTSRPQGPQVDIGAYEYLYSGLHLPVIIRTS
jgi:hypothetical protein